MRYGVAVAVVVGIGIVKVSVLVCVCPPEEQVVTAVPDEEPAAGINGTSPTPLDGMANGPWLYVVFVARPWFSVNDRVQVAPGRDRMSMAEVADE